MQITNFIYIVIVYNYIYIQSDCNEYNIHLLVKIGFYFYLYCEPGISERMMLIIFLETIY